MEQRDGARLSVICSDDDENKEEKMNWYKAYDTLTRHPKTLTLARLLKMNRRETVGLLHDLFSWAVYAADRNGDLKNVTPADLGLALDFKQGERLTQALLEAGFLEEKNGRYRIHDWYEYNGAIADMKEKNRIRQQKSRERKASENL